MEKTKTTQTTKSYDQKQDNDKNSEDKGDNENDKNNDERIDTPEIEVLDDDANVNKQIANDEKNRSG